MKRSQRWNNLQICPRRDSTTGGSELWSNALPVRPRRRMLYSHSLYGCIWNIVLLYSQIIYLSDGNAKCKQWYVIIRTFEAYTLKVHPSPPSQDPSYTWTRYYECVWAVEFRLWLHVGKHLTNTGMTWIWTLTCRFVAQHTNHTLYFDLITTITS